MPNLDIIYDVTWDEKNKQTNKQLTGNLSTYVPAKFRHIRCILLLSTA